MSNARLNPPATKLERATTTISPARERVSVVWTRERTQDGAIYTAKAYGGALAVRAYDLRAVSYWTFVLNSTPTTPIMSGEIQLRTHRSAPLARRLAILAAKMVMGGKP